MALGPGKYDDLCTAAREATTADGIILIVLGGTKGSGFSVQGTLRVQVTLPKILRQIADQIETDLTGHDVQNE
jgi:hypothetical protein